MNGEARRRVPESVPTCAPGTSAGRRTTTALLVTVLGLCSLGLAAAGCKSVVGSTYVSPRVTGRVLSAQTHQPIYNVRVKRVNPSSSRNFDDPPKGGQWLEVAGTWTDKQGGFVLDAEKDLTIIRHQVWYSVTVAFQKQGYVTLRTNFTLKSATNSPSGVPVVNAGDILLNVAKP